MENSSICIRTIEFLTSIESRKDAFSEAFPIIHHFKATGGDASLEGFYQRRKDHEIDSETNLNVMKRLLHIKASAEEFRTENPDTAISGIVISGIEYQRFATRAVEDIPF